MTFTYLLNFLADVVVYIASVESSFSSISISGQATDDYDPTTGEFKNGVHEKDCLVSAFL